MCVCKPNLYFFSGAGLHYKLFGAVTLLGAGGKLNKSNKKASRAFLYPVTLDPGALFSRLQRLQNTKLSRGGVVRRWKAERCIEE
jgi:hypothetical protein